MNPSPDPASSLGSPKLVPSRYYAHLSKQREEREKVALLLPEQRLSLFEEEATALAGDKPLPCRTGAQLREPGAQRFLNFQASEAVKEPPLTRTEREVREIPER